MFPEEAEAGVDTAFEVEGTSDDTEGVATAEEDCEAVVELIGPPNSDCEEVDGVEGCAMVVCIQARRDTGCWLVTQCHHHM